VAEIAVPRSGEYFVGITSEIGRYGCFIRTKAVLSPATKIDLRITYDDREFCTLATVVYRIPDQGIGIAFNSMMPQAQSVLADWLKQLST
jgi:hypothetical protein